MIRSGVSGAPLEPVICRRWVARFHDGAGESHLVRSMRRRAIPGQHVEETCSDISAPAGEGLGPLPALYNGAGSAFSVGALRRGMVPRILNGSAIFSVAWW